MQALCRKHLRAASDEDDNLVTAALGRPPIASHLRGNRRPARAPRRRGRRRPRPGPVVRGDARLARRPGLPEPQHALPADRRPVDAAGDDLRARITQPPPGRLRPRARRPTPGSARRPTRCSASSRATAASSASATTTSPSTPTPCGRSSRSCTARTPASSGPKLVSWDDPSVLQHVGLGLDRFGEVDPITEPGEYDQEQHDAVRDVFVLPSACLLVRADLFRALGGFDPAITFHGDDVDLCWRVHLSGARVVVAPQARVAPPRGAGGPPARPPPRPAAGPPPDALRGHAHRHRPAAAALAGDRRADRRRARRRAVHRARSARRGRRPGRSSGCSRARRRCSPGGARSPSSGASATPRSSTCRTAAAPA